MRRDLNSVEMGICCVLCNGDQAGDQIECKVENFKRKEDPFSNGFGPLDVGVLGYHKPLYQGSACSFVSLSEFAKW